MFFLKLLILPIEKEIIYIYKLKAEFFFFFTTFLLTATESVKDFLLLFFFPLNFLVFLKDLSKHEGGGKIFFFYYHFLVNKG